MIKASSNQESNSGVADVKYQKAIKQISKLISLNTNLKKEVANLQESCDKLRTQYDSLQQKYNNLEFQMQLTKPINNTSTSTACSERRGNDEIGLKGIPGRDHETFGSIIEFIENKRRVDNLEIQLMDKNEKIEALQKELESKIIESSQIYRKYLDAIEQLTKNKQNQTMKNFEAIDRERKQLKKQLQQAEEWIRKISNDYEILKKQLILNQKGTSNSKNVELSLSASIDCLKDPLHDFYLQKLRKSQAEVIRLRKQKVKYKNDLNKLREENEQILKKLMYLATFTEKQQVFIYKFIGGEKNQKI